MPSINKVILAGHLTRDPECRFSTKGTAIGRFTIAINRKWKEKDGAEREEVAFIDCEAFGKTAETISSHFRKGNLLMVEGRLRTDNWEDKQTGQKRSKTLVNVQEFHFMGPKTSDPAPLPTTQATASKADTDDEVPF